MPRLPSLVRIGPFDYLVHVADEVEGDNCGDIDFEKLVITIASGLDHQAQIETLIHEIQHAINHLANIGDDTSEENAVSRSSPYLVCLLRDNPALVELIQKG